jgi:hypothetical protein
MRRLPTIGAYASAPPVAYPGWRLTLPGDPPGGQYHGFLAGTDECACGGACAHCSGLGGIYRAPGEVAPRVNANGDHNVVSGQMSQHRLLGAVSPVMGARSGLPIQVEPVWDFRREPAWPSSWIIDGFPTGATSTVRQPPPPNGPGGTLVQSSSPVPISPAPAPTIAVDPTTSMLPSQGLTLAQQSSSTPGGIDIMGWLAAPSTIFPSLQNWMLLAGGFLAYKLMAPGGKR